MWETWLDVFMSYICYIRRGFSLASTLHQGRLGPGRLHHCMRLIGAAERGMQLMIQRAVSRKAFDKFIAEHGSFLSDAAKVRLLVLASKIIDVKPVVMIFLLLQCRVEVERTRLLVLEAADQLDLVGNKKARGIIAMAKV